MMRTTKFLLVLGVLALLAGSVMAQRPDHAQRKARVHNKEKQDKERNRGVFDRRQRDIIRDFFRNRDNLPPGLARRDQLPPGLQKQLRERGALPPGLQNRIRPLPDELSRRLPRLPDNIRRGVLGRDVVLVDRERNVILDVLENVLD